MAARVRTLPAAIAPVLVGSSLALGAGTFHPLAFVAALLGAVFIQVGTNLSNDYSDARRGADTEDRLGPVRVTAGGLVPPGQVLLATYVTFGLAVACGAYLVAVAGPELLAVGAASILAGVLYTGGPRPYGYEGLGELFVFLFFGIVAVVGSYFVQVQAAAVAGVRVRGPGGPAGERDPRRQQRSRHRDRPARGQAHAGGAARAPAHANAVHVHARRRLPDGAAAVGVRVDVGVAAAAVGCGAARAAARRDRPQPFGRPVAERGPRAHRGAAAAVLPAVLRRDPRERRHQLVRLELERATFALTRPLEASYGRLAERELALVAITDRAGVTGYGEAAPLEAYDGTSLDAVVRALERYATVLAEGEAERAGAVTVLDACRAQADMPAALAAVDLALWDLAGRRRERPVAELLSDVPAPAVAVNATLWASDRAGVAEQAAAAARAGFGCMKLKVGIGDDAGRVAAARAAAGPHAALRLDANGAWDVEGAVASIEALSPAGLELVEEPTHGVRGCAPCGNA